MYDWEVRAILDGRKTQMRRVTKINPAYMDAHCKYCADRQENIAALVSGDLSAPLRPPYGKPGDRLWVRETWAPVPEHRPIADPERYPRFGAFYRAKNDRPMWAGKRWRPSTNMPRWASRITLEVVDVWVERLQDISEEDAVAEGCQARPADGTCHLCPSGPCSIHQPAQGQFHAIWDSTNAKKPGHSWDDNPWVWVNKFKRIGGE